jgi:hypothetical protein
MRLPVPADVRVPPELREALAFHCISAHCNAAALENTPEENLQIHLDEHFESCGIRNHDWASLHYDERKIEIVLEEAEEADFGYPRTTR